MSKRNPIWHREENNIFIKPMVGGKTKIGVIDNISETLYVTDKDNWHINSNSLGLDEEIIETPLLKFNFITMLFKGDELTTTRYYFWKNAKQQDLYNGRKMIFLPIRSFGTAKALEVEKSDYLSKLSEYDVFDIAEMERKGVKGPKGIRLLDYYTESLEKVKTQIKAQEARRLI